MQHRLRKIAVAVAIPAAAVVGIALTAGAATNAPTTAAPGAAATGENPGGGGGGGGGATNGPQNNPNLQPSGQNFQSLKTLKTFKTVTKSPVKTTPATPTPSKTSVSPSKTTAKPTGTASGTKTGGPGVAPVPGGGGAGTNCTGQPNSTPVTVKIGTAGGKQALVDNAGCALYINSQDTPQQSACTGQCVAQWPPLVGPGQAGQGVDQTNLGVFARDDGSQQVTYFGHQLYYFKGDTAPGEANGQGMNQTWWLIDPSGNPIQQ